MAKHRKIRIFTFLTHFETFGVWPGKKPNRFFPTLQCYKKNYFGYFPNMFVYFLHFVSVFSQACRFAYFTRYLYLCSWASPPPIGRPKKYVFRLIWENLYLFGVFLKQNSMFFHVTVVLWSRILVDRCTLCVSTRLSWALAAHSYNYIRR